MNKKMSALSERLRDERSGKVLFVSHCILNENTRYTGGAFCGGVNRRVLDSILSTGCGIVQMPCPEQHAWGGVLKPMIWLPIGTYGRPAYAALRIAYPFFIAWTRLVYGRIASRVAGQIGNYIDSGYEIAGIVGIDGSPTCGVRKRASMAESFAYTAALKLQTLSRKAYNEGLYGRCLREGRGMFIAALVKKLEKRKIRTGLLSIDLVEEMNGAGPVIHS